MNEAVLSQVESYVQGKAGAAGIVPAVVGVGDPLLSELLTKLNSIEMEYEQTKKIVPENNPRVVSLVDAMNKIKPNILENIRNQRRNLEAGKRDLSVTNTKYSSMLNTIPKKERELLGISRQQSIKNNIYTFLLQKREEAALSLASTVPNSRIIDKAESSDNPIGLSNSFIYLMAVLISMMLFIGGIFTKEMLVRTIQQRSDIEKNTSVPFLGEVMFDANKKNLVIAEGERTFIAEQFRQLRTSLGYLGINEANKKILITSTISGEGKSFIAANIGISLSLMGKKVVMVEIDLRKPKLSDVFQIARKTGISNYLIGKLKPEQIIKNTGIANLFLIPSGPLPPNPSELIANKKVEELFSYLEKTFDYIIIDTAPIDPVTEAFILSPLCDATLFIVRHGYTQKVFINKLEEHHKYNNLKNLAIVYNGVKPKGFSVYGYGYGYGYGYTEENKKLGLFSHIKNKLKDASIVFI